MSDSMCFGYRSNGKVCSCGRHHGCGEYSAEQRAAMAAFGRDRMQGITSSTMLAYVADWEKYHGRVTYRMEVVGKNSGYIYKNDKGKDVMGPVYVGSSRDGSFAEQMPMSYYDNRADIHG